VEGDGSDEDEDYALSAPQDDLGSPEKVKVATKYGATAANIIKVQEKLETLFFPGGSVWGESYNMGHFGQLKIYYSGNFSILENLNDDGNEKVPNFPEIRNPHWMKHGQIGMGNWPAREGKIPPAPPAKPAVNLEAEAMKCMGEILASAITDNNTPKITPAEHKEQAVQGVKHLMLEQVNDDEGAAGNWERLQRLAANNVGKKKMLENLVLIASHQIFATSFDFDKHPVDISNFIHKFNQNLEFFNSGVDGVDDKVVAFDFSLFND
jgi:hypothetical protein